MKEILVHHAWISLGSNLGDRAAQLAEARGYMAISCGKVLRVSGIYESKPLGFESAYQFLNQCLLLETRLSPKVLLEVLLGIERSMGRIRKVNEVTDRPIDLDILFYDNLVIHTTDLQVPHPRMKDRKFVLQPLAEIAADKTDPVTGLTVAALLAQCQDSTHLEKIIP